MEAFLLMQCTTTDKQRNQINILWWTKDKGSWLTDNTPSWATMGSAKDKDQAPKVFLGSCRQGVWCLTHRRAITNIKPVKHCFQHRIAIIF